MRTFLTDEKNDFVQDSSGNLLLTTGLTAEAQETRHFAATARDEMIHQTQNGVPFWPLTFGASASIRQFEAAVRARLEQAPDVVEVISVVASQNPGILSYTADIRTTSGTATVNG